jgi:hypothetical protein
MLVMALLESLASRAALNAFFSKGGFETLLKETNREALAKEFELAVRARNPDAAIWSIVSQLEQSLKHLRTEEIARSKRVWVGILTWTGLYSNQQLQTKRKNTCVLLAICYAFLGERAYVERCLEELNEDYLEQVFESRSDLERNVATAAFLTVGFAVASLLIPAKAAINIVAKGDIYPEPEVEEITDYVEFANKILGVTPKSSEDIASLLDS